MNGNFSGFIHLCASRARNLPFDRVLAEKNHGKISGSRTGVRLRQEAEKALEPIGFQRFTRN
jgi:hypothetical protein